MSLRTIATLLLSFTAVACMAESPGGDSGNPGGNNPGGNPGGDPPGDPGGGTISASEFVTATSHKDCDDAFVCKANFPTDAGVTFADAFGASADACYAQAAMYNDPQKVEAAVAAGKIMFDGAAAKKCVDGLPGAPMCTTYWTQGPAWPAECDTAMTGTVATGGACTVDLECASPGNYCDNAKCVAGQ